MSPPAIDMGLDMRPAARLPSKVPSKIDSAEPQAVASAGMLTWFAVQRHAPATATRPGPGPASGTLVLRLAQHLQFSE